jgi:hypothetical protein
MCLVRLKILDGCILDGGRLNHWSACRDLAAGCKIGNVSGKKPSNKIWPVIFAMAFVVIAIWIFTVLLHP